MTKVITDAIAFTLYVIVAFTATLWSIIFITATLQVFWKPLLALFFVTLGILTFDHFDGMTRARKLFASLRKSQIDPSVKTGVVIPAAK